MRAVVRAVVVRDRVRWCLTVRAVVRDHACGGA